jgi:hypothetical protein|nr:MAG TPA: hypothetical protein [Caudoviricetes sp.]
MRVYKDKLEVERLNEIVERIKEFSFILGISVDSDEHGKTVLELEFTKDILAFDKENKEYVYTEAWCIKEGESFEFYPDDLRLIVE